MVAAPKQKKFFESDLYKGFAAIFPVARWLIVVVAAIVAGYALYITNTNAQNLEISNLKTDLQAFKQQSNDKWIARNQQIVDLDKKIDKMLTREVYDAGHEADKAEMQLIQRELEQLLGHYQETR